MKKDNKAIEPYRIVSGEMGSDATYGNNGWFEIPLGGRDIFIVVSDGGDWEHVSVSMQGRCPTWQIMCMVKDLFWADDEVVIQYHPAKKDYVNSHEFCLHMWKPVGIKLPVPPINFV